MAGSVDWPLAEFPADVADNFSVFWGHGAFFFQAECNPNLALPQLFPPGRAAGYNGFMTSFSHLRDSEFSNSFGRGPYLNHAGVSPAPDRVVRAVTDATLASAHDPMAFFMQHVIPARDAARERLARLMGVPAEHIAITKNTGHGLSLLADSLRLDAGDNIVAADCEYPSVVYPWYAQADRGIETRLVPTRPDGTFTPDDFAAHMDTHTKVVTLSWVQFGTGFRANLAQFSDMAHANGAVLIVDVIQGLGVLPCEARSWGADAVVTGVHKWLLAPGGTGGLYVTPSLLERMRLVNMGAASVENVSAFDPLVFVPKNSVQRYEEGTPNGLGAWD